MYFSGLLPSVVQAPGFPISPWICQPSQTSLLANHPQRDAPETLGLLPHLKSAGSATSWMQMKGVAGFLLLGESKLNRQWMSRPWRPNTAVAAARTNLELSQGQKKTAPASPSWAQVTCKDGCRSKAELWFPAEDSDGRGIIIYSTFKGFFSRKPTYCCKGTANHQPATKMASLKLLSTKNFGQ